MGEVYVGEDTRLGRNVAIKVLPAEFAGDPGRLARFEQEARAAAALNHPHIAVVHDVGSETGDDGTTTHFMVQEYLEGETLREPLKKGALPLKKAFGLATEIAEAPPPLTLPGSSTGISSRRTSSSPRRGTPRCWTSVWRSSPTTSEARAAIEEAQQSRRDVARPPSIRGAWLTTVAAGVVAVVAIVAVATWKLVYPGVSADTATSAPATEALEASERPSIAVLPFENLSADPDKRYFSDGISEDLITRLSSWRRFPVISHFSSFAYDAQPSDVREVARKLGARYLVLGSVRRAGDRVRIGVRLINGSTGVVVWSDQFDRRFDDVLVLQTEISREIVGAMYPQLDDFDRGRAVREEPRNLAAWDWAQRGWWYFTRATHEDVRQARHSFQRAIELEPLFSDGHSGLALSHYLDVSFEYASSPEESTEALVRSAERAVSLDSQSPAGHHALGHAYALTGDREKMLAAYKRSIELNPSSALVLTCSGEGMALAGRPDEAIALLEEAIRLSPQDPAIEFVLHGIALAHFGAQRYEQAVDWASKTVQRRPDFAWAYRTMAASYAQLGRQEEARRALDKAIELAPEFTIPEGARVLLTAELTAGERYRNGLRLAGLSD